MSRWTTAVVAAAVTIGLASCADGPADGQVDGTIDVVETVEDVEYYYACGNELLELPDGRVFHPLLPDDQERVDTERRAEAAGPAPTPDARLVLAAPTTVLAVVAPGPGDDTGTLTIYEDGLAHWRSDSGIEAWLTEDEVTYDWVC